MPLRDDRPRPSADGEWRVIEVGDGQVSDLPSSVDVMGLIAPLIAR
ncbi:ATP-grasp domain-containing protein [Nocardia sp. NPDC004415]